MCWKNVECLNELMSQCENDSAHNQVRANVVLDAGWHHKKLCLKDVLMLETTCNNMFES